MDPFGYLVSAVVGVGVVFVVLLARRAGIRASR
jgi:hypothetical protein